MPMPALPVNAEALPTGRTLLAAAFSVALLAAMPGPVAAQDAAGPIDIGSRRELMVDKHLIAKMGGGAELRLHHPTPRNVALETDRPWEGPNCGYITTFRDGDKYRMYYKGEMMRDVPAEKGEQYGMDGLYMCYAESDDGIHWERPNLGLVEFKGSKKNNIILKGKGSHGFAPFKDPNPDARPEARYKALGRSKTAVEPKPGGKKYLFAFKSPDGIHWSQMEGPLENGALLSQEHGDFDSQNVAFWDRERGEYRIFFRRRRNIVNEKDLARYRGHEPKRGRGYYWKERVRDIKTATSKDFVHWNEAKFLEYPGAPVEELYTNQIMQYPRAPHLFIGFPSRYVQRSWSHAIEQLPQLEHRKKRAEMNERYGTALTDGLFMSSRDGRTFKRWGEAFIRPGPQQKGNWAYGDNYQSWGLIRTEAQRKGVPDRYSFFATEGDWRGDSTTFRRYTIRTDGFVSVNAPLAGGSFVTKPLMFSGDELRLNFATSAAGRLRVELQSAEGEPIDGYTLSDCDPVIGDELDRAVTWNGETDVGDLAGEPVRLKITLHDADLYAFRFVPTD